MKHSHQNVGRQRKKNAFLLCFWKLKLFFFNYVWTNIWRWFNLSRTKIAKSKGKFTPLIVETDIQWGCNIPTVQIKVCIRIDVRLELCILQHFSFYSWGRRGEQVFVTKSSVLCNALCIELSRRNSFHSACKSFPEGRIMDLAWKSRILKLQNLKDIQCFKF